MAPDAGVDVEVGGAVARAVRVAPEGHRHRGHRRRDHQLALLADHRAPGLIERLDARPQVAAGDLAGPDRNQRAAADERGADVGAAAHRGEQDVALDGVVHPVEALGGERRAGGADAAQRAQVVARARGDALLAAGHEERRAGAEPGDARLLGEAPQGAQVGVPRVAVEADHRGPDQQS